MISFTDPIKQEIWSTLRAMNHAWTQGDPDDLVRFFHPDMVAITATDRYRRDGATACIAGWKAFSNAAHIHHWEEIDPIIKVFGDSAVVTYYFDICFDMGGKRRHLNGRDMFFFVKEQGRWWAVADHYSPYPA